MPFCTNCGTNSPDGTTFCPNCGTSLSAAAANVQAAAPVPVTPADDKHTMGPVPNVGDYLKTFLLLFIPIANLIMLIVWAAGGSKYPYRKGFAGAYLILIAAAAVVSVLLVMALIPAFGSSEFLGSMYSSF